MDDAKATGTVSEDSHAPTPVRPNYRVLQWLLLLAALYTLYLAKTLFVPIVFALLLTLLLGPVVAFLRRYHVPRPVSALLLLAVMAVPFTLLGMELSQPAQKWAENLPELSERFTDQINTLTGAWGRQDEVVSEEERSFFARLLGEDEVDDEARDEEETNQVMERLTQGGIELLVYVLGAMPVFFAQLITCLTLTVFLLVFGPRLLESTIHNLPQIEDKKGAHALIEAIEHELSRYIGTVSAINAMLGLSTTLAFLALGVEDAVFWGVLVGMLNFAPYVGTIIGLTMLSLAGLAQYGLEWQAMIPALTYFTLNALEAQVVTPMVLGRHMRLNPLIIMIWILICGWLWGFVGVLLAVPLLVCLKLAASRVSRSGHWVRIMETRY